MPPPAAQPRQEDGAAAVEFAILSVLVFAILFGLVTAGLAWTSKNTLTHAAREGARYGSTLQFDATAVAPDPAAPSVWLKAVTDRTIDSAFGDLGSAIPGRYVCVAYVESSSDGSKNWRQETGTPASGTSPPHKTCAYVDDGRGDQPRVQVLVQRKAELITIVLPTKKLALTSEGIARYELPKVGP